MQNDIFIQNNLTGGEGGNVTAPCFLCGEMVQIKLTKNTKPYFICDPCGVQAFIRRKEGIARLSIYLQKSAPERRDLLRLLDLSQQLRELEQEKDKIELNPANWFLENKPAQEMLELIKKKISEVQAKISELHG